MSEVNIEIGVWIGVNKLLVVVTGSERPVLTPQVLLKVTNTLSIKGIGKVPTVGVSQT
jgi:hypothetical protein